MCERIDCEPAPPHGRCCTRGHFEIGSIRSKKASPAKVARFAASRGADLVVYAHAIEGRQTHTYASHDSAGRPAIHLAGSGGGTSWVAYRRGESPGIQKIRKYCDEGRRESCLLLASWYREGYSVPLDHAQASALEERARVLALGHPPGRAARSPGAERGSPRPAIPVTAGRPGARYRIVNPGAIYATINRTNCIAWPSEQIKRLSGDRTWGRNPPRAGDVGEYVSSSWHCSQPHELILILRVGDRYVPVGARGLEEVRAPR